MHPLVAEIDGIGDLAQRPAVETERADHALELGSSAVEVALSLHDPICSLPRLRER